MNETTKMPVGMIIILILIGWGLVSILFVLKNPVAQLGPFLFKGASAIVINLIYAIIIVSIIFGVIKRFIWAWKLTIGYYIFSILLVIVNMLSFYTNKGKFLTFYTQGISPELAQLITESSIAMTLTFSSIAGIILGLIIIWYFNKKKDFFVN